MTDDELDATVEEAIAITGLDLETPGTGGDDAPALLAAMRDLAATLPADAKAALLLDVTEQGGKAALVVRAGDEWTVAAYLGAHSWQKRAFTGGVSVRKVWR